MRFHSLNHAQCRKLDRPRDAARCGDNVTIAGLCAGFQQRYGCRLQLSQPACMAVMEIVAQLALQRRGRRGQIVLTFGPLGLYQQRVASFSRP